MAARKSAKKTTPTKRVPAHGKGKLLTGGMPGNKGGGRPKDAFLELCRQYASGAMTNAHIGAILNNPDHPQFLPALRFVSENGYGKATEHVEVKGELSHSVRHIKWGDEEIPI